MKHGTLLRGILILMIAFFWVSCKSTDDNTSTTCKKDSECGEGQVCIGKKCIAGDFLCQGKTCNNHGTCVVKDGKPMCECHVGYIADGLSCLDAPCVKHGDCEANEVCVESECKDETSLCDGVGCSNHGECQVKHKKPVCVCEDGYLAEDLNCVEDKCSGVICSIIEACNNETGECEIVTNPCDNVDCGDHGECVYDAEGVASCECENSYTVKDGKCVFEVPCVKTAETDSCDDGLDNNCDGIINAGCSCNGLNELSCYTGDHSRIDVGECKAGMMFCIAGENWGSCDGQVLPTEESCDGKDNDCDGKVDQSPEGETLSKACYTGNIAETQHPNTRCKTGVYLCSNGAYDESTCTGEVLPADTEVCGNSIDDNCDGRVDEDCVAPMVTCSNDVTRTYIFESAVNLSAQATDSNGTVVSTSWAFLSKPDGTASTLSQASGNTTKFTPDTVGEYVVRFTAIDNDGEQSYCDIRVNAETRDFLNVTLTWDKGGQSDMDLHLLKPGAPASSWGSANDCFWAVPSPNWGDPNSSKDNPGLDRDDTDGFGPEVIQIERPMEGSYTVGVEYFDDQGEGSSTATIKIICNDEEFTYTSSPLSPKDRWAVIDIVWNDESCTLEPASRNY